MARTKVTSGVLGDNAVTTAKIADDAITSAKIADDAITSAKIADNSVDIARLSVSDGSNGQALTTNGSGALAFASVGTVDGSIVTAKLADDAVTSAKLAHALDVITSMTVGGASNGVEITQGSIKLKNGGVRSTLDFYCEASNAHYVRLQAPVHANFSGNITLTLPPNDGNSGQFLQTDGSGVMSWAAAGGLYNNWLVKTAGYTMLSGDQIVGNHASTAFTLTLPASPSAGAVVTVKNVGAALITIGRNSQPINSSANDALLPQNNAATLVYVDSTIGWATI